MSFARNLITFLIIWLTVGSGLGAQPPVEPTVTTPDAAEAAVEATTPEKIAELQKAAEETAELADENKKAAVELAQQALNDLKSAEAMAQTIADLEKKTSELPQTQQQKEQELSELSQASEVSIEGNPSLAELDIARNDLQQRINDLEQKLTLPNVDPAARSATRKADRQLLIDLPPQLQEIQNQLQAAAPEGELPVMTNLRRAALRAKQLHLQKKAVAAQNELTLFDAADAVKLPAIRREILTRELNRAKKLLELYVNQINRLRQEEAKARASEARIAAMQAQPLLQPILKSNEEITTEETDIRRLDETAQESLKEVQSQLTDLRDDYHQIVELDKQQLGHSGSMGLLLKRLRAQLPNIREHQLQQQSRLRTLEEAEFTLYERRDALNDLLNVEAVADEIVAASGTTGQEQTELRDNALTALRNQQDYLENVVNAYDRYTTTLTSLDQQETQLIKEAQEFASFVDQRILWVRSHQPLSIAEILEDQQSDSEIRSIETWSWILKVIVSDFKRVPFLYGIAGVMFVTLLIIHRRIGRSLRDVAKTAQSRGVVSFLPTFRALQYTLMSSLLWPGVMWFLAWRLLSSPDPTRMVLVAAVSLSRLAGVFLFLEWLRQSLRPNGLCEAHFGWPKSTLRALRTQLRKLMLIGLPLAAAVSTAHFYNGDGHHAAIERLLFIAFMLVLSWFSHTILHPRRGAMRELRSWTSGGWFDRLDYVWYVLAVGLPLLLAGLAATGYYYSAQKLMLRSQVTVFVILGGFYLRALTHRWLMLRHRRLKFAQLQERRAALAAQEEAGSAEPGAPMPDVSSEETDLNSISQQSQRLVSTTLVLVGLMSLWFIWSDVIPAVRFLDRWPLWESVTQGTKQVEQDDGTFLTEITYEVEAITIANVAMACLILSLTFTAARNLPGLLEITVLQHLPIDRSTAYAITALVRYSLVLIGIMATSQTLGIGWSKVQWLAAALTFGLGFGLQEIFANFVSGIIILFEQPVRVGDVVTIDGVSGVVNRIRIRATTIVDWDRKEYIVPNREFITGRLLNWTLTDKMNRLVVNVGVAYGSDTSLVRELILDVAREHENVLEDPAPLVTFESFGDSSLNFVLRAYLPNLENRLQTIHDLHATINDRLAVNHIEIPFPQRDLHLRTTVRIDESHHPPSSNGAHNGSPKIEAVSTQQD
ncbi:MAG: mechanosensitive ion channel [Planctomycetaceae bacterium]